MKEPRLVLARHSLDEWCAVNAAVLRGLGCSDEYIARYLDSLRRRARRESTPTDEGGPTDG